MPPTNEEKTSYPETNSFGAIIKCFARISVNKSGTIQEYCYRPKGHPGDCSSNHNHPDDLDTYKKKGHS